MDIAITTCYLRSHLTRGAWIEIILSFGSAQIVTGRTSHEVRGLKYALINQGVIVTGRTSHEVRGLKCVKRRLCDAAIESHLTRGAWIEIILSFGSAQIVTGRTSHEVRGLKSLYTMS